MKITRIIINNYRNLKSIDVRLNDTIAIIGENNSGKSNFLRALTLPFLSDEFSSSNKKLSWVDINNKAKQEYYQWLIDNQDAIKNGSISQTDFIKNMPVISVEVHLLPDITEGFFVKELCFDIDGDEILYGLRYEYKPNKLQEIYEMVKNVLEQETLTKEILKDVKMNLLPVEYYSYSIYVPGKESVPYDVLKLYKYTSLEAERDDFSRTKEKIGSKSLVKLLQSGLSNDDKLTIEKEYANFFEKIKSVSKMDSLINWQEYTKIEDAKDFFAHISILPNMPQMQSLLSSIRLGYSDAELSLQGLGYRNLILLLVLIHSLMNTKDDIALHVLTIEEPEAHLCINNIRLMVSFLRIFTNKNPSAQLFYSTHNTEFINKMDLKNVVVIHDGQAFSFLNEFTDEELDYLTKNPNLDLFKLFFSKKCILFEGISEEMLIRAYIDSKDELSDIEPLSFHKGFVNIIKIWKKVNCNTSNRLGVIRDYDNQPSAKKEHDVYDDGKSICVRTTSEYTLEPEFVKTADNYKVLKSKYGEAFGWQDYDIEQMQKAWREAKASDMLTICKDIANGNLSELKMPNHIQQVLDFFTQKDGESE